MRIQITSTEIDRRQLTAEHLAQAVESVRQNGFVILGQVIPTPPLDLLFERMLTDLNTLLNASDQVLPVQFVPGHLQQDAPPLAPYVFAELVANPWVIQVTQALLGAGVKNTYFTVVIPICRAVVPNRFIPMDNSYGLINRRLIQRRL